MMFLRLCFTQGRRQGIGGNGGGICDGYGTRSQRLLVYYRQMDHPTTPRKVSDQRDALFGPFKQIQEFSQKVFTPFSSFHFFTNF